MKVPADESPVDIGSLKSFLDSQVMSAAMIRKTVTHLSWENQMSRVIEGMDF